MSFTCQEFIWHNPARLPSPAQWVNVERSRVKDSFTKLWWMAPTEKPKASNQCVLQEYSKAMKTLLKRGTYNAGKRPTACASTRDADFRLALCKSSTNSAIPHCGRSIGYRIVAAEKRGAKIKKKLEVDPIHADTVRLIYRLALNGDGDSGPMGIKSITTYLNERNIRTRDGGRWGIASVHQILTRTTYIGQHRFNTRDHKTRTAKPEAEHAVMDVARSCRRRSPAVAAARSGAFDDDDGSVA